jgi:hypothetical protein
MIQFIERKKIDIEKWNDCLKSNSPSSIFSQSWYLDVCAKDWGGLVYGDYEAIFPLAWKSKLGINYLYQPYFTRNFGVYSKFEIKKEIYSEFINLIPAHFKYWDFCLDDQVLLKIEDAYIQHKKFQALDLKNNYHEISNLYTDNLNRNLRKAEKLALSIIPDYNPDLVVEQFRIVQKAKKLEFTEDDLTKLKQLMKAASHNAEIKCWASIAPSGEIMSGAFFMETNNRIVYLKGFSSDVGKKNGAMHFLFDRLIRSQCDQEKVLDFGGSNIETIARFFKSFGAKDYLYLHLQVNRLPKIIKWAKK